MFKEDDNKFYAKISDDLYFVAEKITKENFKLWRDIIYLESEVLDNMTSNIKLFNEGDKSLETDDPEEYNMLLKYKNSEKMMPSMADAFFKLKEMRDSGAERWIIYAFNKKPVKLTENNMDDEVANIEMMMLAVTDDEVPFTSHMGISRAPIHIYKNKTRHQQIATRFHGFAAKLMHVLHPEKKYMITTPLPEMKDILAKNLPPKSVFVGHEEVNAESPLRQTGYVSVYGSSPDFRFQLLNPEKEIIFTMDPQQAAIKHWWFFNIMTPSKKTPYVIVNLSNLSKLFDN